MPQTHTENSKGNSEPFNSENSLILVPFEVTKHSHCILYLSAKL